MCLGQDPSYAAARGDEDDVVRYQAPQVLGKLEPSVLAPHAGATLQRLGDEDDDVRHCAVRVLGKLEPSAPAPHVGAIPQLPSCFSLVVFAVGPRRRRRRLVLVGSCVVFRRRRFSWSWSSSSRFSLVVLAVVF